MKKLLAFNGVCFVLLTSQMTWGQVAVTEFLNDPLGSDTDTGKEYVELFNYSSSSVDIQNWVLKDEDNDSLVITTSSFVIPSGGFVVYASQKDTFETEWLGGISDERVIEYGGPNETTMQLSNSGDELILLDASGDTVWNLAWTNDDEYDASTSADDGYSTYLDYATDFATTVITGWGSKATPGIDRDSTDSVSGSLLGYEGGAFTVDLFARESSNGDIGSPLAGYYYNNLIPKTRSDYQIAITEFMNDALGADTDAGREYIELFNYGTASVDIQNWMVKDEDHDILRENDWLVITTSSLIIPGGEFMLYASNKDTIEREWFDGSVDPRVLEYGGPNSDIMQLSNSGDELILLDAEGDTVWNLAWTNDDEYDASTSADDGYSTYLDYATDFSTTATSWGSKASPGIVRDGNDNISGSPLGYELGAFTPDDSATISLNGDWGSPLSGKYNTVITVAVDVPDNPLLPNRYALKQNYPNPFNPSTTIRYDLPEQADVRLVIYDLLGKEVAKLVNDDQQIAGSYTIRWAAPRNNRTVMSSGIYFLHLEAKGKNRSFNEIVKMVYLK